jgi:hypothetical protein
MTKSLRELLKEEEFILAHSSREFSPWCLGPMCLGTTSWWRENLLHFLADRKQRETHKKRPGTRLPKNLPLVTYFLLLGPTS